MHTSFLMYLLAETYGFPQHHENVILKKVGLCDLKSCI